jgi:hypothetical protein
VAHEDLLSSAERLMPDGTLTMYIEIKILPSWATVIHGSLQNVVPAQPAQALTPKNIFEDMVDNFVNLKLGSVLIVFRNGEQNCHAFPLAARSVVLRTMLMADMREGNTGRIEMQDVSLKTGRNMLFFLYNGWLEEGADLKGLLPLEDKYNIQELKEICENGLKKSDANCVELLALADMHGVRAPLLRTS